MNENTGKVNILPDGSACFTESRPLPSDHWLYEDSVNVLPKPIDFNMDYDTARNAIFMAGEYAIRAATNNGKIIDFDPDALLQRLVCAFLGEEQSCIRVETTE